MPGKGTFVAKNKEVQKTRAKELLTEFDELVKELIYLSVDPDQLKHRVDQVKGEE